MGDCFMRKNPHVMGLSERITIPSIIRHVVLFLYNLITVVKQDLNTDLAEYYSDEIDEKEQ